MPHATRRDQTLRAAARDFAYYLLRDLRDPVRQFLYSGGGSIPTYDFMKQAHPKINFG